MHQSALVRPLSKNEADFKAAVADNVKNLKIHCRNCSNFFTKENVWTPEGWANTQHTGMRESCYEDIVDNITGEDA